jgi:exonuclease SbcC
VVAEKKKVLEELQAGIVPLKKSAQFAARAVEEVRSRVQNTDAALRKAHQLDAANDLRRALEPGGSCPVCEQTVASPPSADLNPEVAAAEKGAAAARKLLGEAEAKARSAQESLTRAQAKVGAEQETLKGLANRCSELEAKVTKEDNELRAKLAAYMPGDAALVEGWVETTVASLAESRRTHEQAKRRLEVAERAAEKAKGDETSARERVEEKQAARSHLEEDRRSSQKRLGKLQEEIAAVTRSEDPAAEAAVVGKQVEALESALKAASAEAANAKSRMTTATEALRLTTATANKAVKDATSRGKRRDEEVARAGFPDESAVRSALLDEDTIADLTERVRTHDQECHAVGQRIQALNEALGDFRISDEELAAAEKAAKHLNGEVEKQHGEQRTLEERIGRMKQRLERSKKMRAELETEEQALWIYNQLAGDLRSDKFQAYVLEEAFTELVQGASVRLMSLTGERYSLLFRDGDILVVDNDNAGETRISDTLSGGETFLTSLSLALELSDQVQRAAGAVHLDSLFIDEGFGTLDPDTLTLVSDTIQSLGVGGRMVGIITHIPELREEFAQQIIVTKHQGFSTVEVRGLVAAA